MMTNNLRFYSTLLLLLEFLIVAMGVKFVQMLAPVRSVFGSFFLFSRIQCYPSGVSGLCDSFNSRLLRWRD